MEDMKPCPFCGNEPFLRSTGIVEPIYAVGCKKCGVITTNFQNKNTAIIAWNTRHKENDYRMIMQDIKPCPFCEVSRIGLNVKYGTSHSLDLFQMFCWECGATTSDSWCGTQKEAVESWNKRR